MKAGHLYVISTPIGNLEDLSPRALATLREVDLIAAEDTRRISRLLSRFEISKPLIRCDEAVERLVAEKILRKLQDSSNVALVSDAGAPNVSDPGDFLVNKAAEEGISIIPIPGPSAVTTALSICGFPSVPFTFLGFLEKKGKKRRFQLERIESGRETTVFFESPFRIRKSIEVLKELAPDRQAFLGRELTKLHEEHFRGSLGDIAEQLQSKEPKGEFTGVISAKSKKELREEERAR